jgi:hypothetical protein
MHERLDSSKPKPSYNLLISNGTERCNRHNLSLPLVKIALP